MAEFVSPSNKLGFVSQKRRSKPDRALT